MNRILAFAVLLNVLALNSYAQQKIVIHGNVKNNITNALPAVSITVKDSDNGTFTDSRGNFNLYIKKLPATIIVSSVGYQKQEIVVIDPAKKIDVSLLPTSTLGQEIVVSASRIQQKILESPVTIERINGTDIHITPAASFYDVLGSFKGVDITASSLFFKTPSSRGFNTSGSYRVNQIIDGMDNQTPGLNFFISNLAGLTELDVDNVELLPGASSALYGPGGMNGTIVMTSKNPFKYQGLSFQTKTGIMNTDKKYRDISAYHNWGLRWANKVSEKFAFKIATEIIAAKDWLGYDERNYSRMGALGKIIPGNRATDPNYDGINIYGDEVTADIRAAVLNTIGENGPPELKNFIDTLNQGQPINVSRTGYKESEVIKPNAINYKISGALHYKITNRLEAILTANWGTGNAIYTTARRSNFKNVKIGQYKLELNHKYWILRGYTTQEDAGESHDATITTIIFNESWKPSGGQTGWFSTYAQAYLGARLTGQNDFDAQTIARAASDIGRPKPGSPEFQNLFDAIRKTPVNKGGGLVVTKSGLYMLEGQYNFSRFTQKVADVIVGGNYKRYVLKSGGSLFADTAGNIPINEWGAYIIASKKILNDKLNLAFSGRYDKNENFRGRFTPRATALIKVAENNHIRLSYQTAYRFPSTQQQWINLYIGSNTRFIGGNKDFQRYFQFDTNPVFQLSALPANTSTYQFSELKPETLQSFELGYKGLILEKKLLIDVYTYYGKYQNFLTRTQIIQPYSGNIRDVLYALSNNIPVSNVGPIFSIPVNTTSKVKTYGFGLGVNYRLPLGFAIGANVSSDNLEDVPADFITYFATPKYRTNLSIINDGFGYKKRFGFCISHHWQDSFFYEGEFASDFLSAFNLIDAQVNYKLPLIKSMIKLGSNNLLNKYYYTGPGNAKIGGLYYLSYGYNVF